MNFDFSDDLQQIRAEAQDFLRAHAAGSARQALETGSGFDRTLWQQLGAQGWIGAAIDESHGGSGLGSEGLCVIAEQLGAALAATPFASTAYLAAQAVSLFGNAEQRNQYLPRFADGSLIGCFALAEAPGAPSPSGVRASVRDGVLNGVKSPVIDGSVADVAIVAARHGAGDIGLFAVDLSQGVARQKLETLDPSRDCARLQFDASAADALPGARGWGAVTHLLDRAAILFAFEQIGGAQTCLDMARDYALQRQAFGRSIGSFQAIKHKLADVYVAIELARSNAYYGAWALSADAPDLTSAAAAARVAATTAFEMAAQENIQTHGGMGFTWETDCHLYLRRSKHLSLAIGAAPFWKDRLIDAIEQRNAA